MWIIQSDDESFDIETIQGGTIDFILYPVRPVHMALGYVLGEAYWPPPPVMKSPDISLTLGASSSLVQIRHALLSCVHVEIVITLAAVNNLL